MSATSTPHHPSPELSNRLESMAVRMNRVIDMIELRLADPPRLAEMAAACALSPTHFHRSFCQAFGETPHDYVLRRRLEVAASQLRYFPEASIGSTAQRLGFSSPAVFARSFRRYFGMGARQWCAGGWTQWSPLPEGPVKPVGWAGGDVSVVNLPEVDVAYFRSVGSYFEHRSLRWQRFQAWCEELGMSGVACYAIGLDDPTVTPPARCRMDLCVALPPGVRRLPTRVPLKFLAGGLHAVIHFDGAPADIWSAWRWLLDTWLPRSGLAMSMRSSFQRYLPGYPAATEQREVFDLCIPVRQRSL